MGPCGKQHLQLKHKSSGKMSHFISIFLLKSGLYHSSCNATRAVQQQPRWSARARHHRASHLCTSLLRTNKPIRNFSKRRQTTKYSPDRKLSARVHKSPPHSLVNCCSWDLASLTSQYVCLCLCYLGCSFFFLSLVGWLIMALYSLECNVGIK